MYNPGDTVKLRDGIPGLTVINTAHDTVYVTWKENGVPVFGAFPPQVLKLKR